MTDLTCPGCGHVLEEDKSVTVWARSEFGTTCLKTHPGACEEAALAAKGYKRRPEPKTKELTRRS